jgi:hypothetical protein
MFFFTHLDGGQLATQIVALSLAAILGLGAFVRYTVKKPQYFAKDGYVYWPTLGALLALCVGLIIPWNIQSSRNDNTAERATVMGHAEFYGYEATGIHANSNEFTADFGDCSLPVKYTREDNEVIATKVALNSDYVKDLNPPPGSMLFLDEIQAMEHAPAFLYCSAQARGEIPPSD